MSENIEQEQPVEEGPHYTTSFFHKDDNVIAFKAMLGIHIGLVSQGSDLGTEENPIPLICITDQMLMQTYLTAIERAELLMSNELAAQGKGKLTSWLILVDGVPEISEIKTTTPNEIGDFYKKHYPNKKIIVSQKLWATVED